MKDKFEEYLKEELNKIESPPIHLNNILLLKTRKKEKLNTVKLLFFILSIFQSIFIITIGIVFMPYIFLKIGVSLFGLVLLNTTLFIYLFKLRRV